MKTIKQLKESKYENLTFALAGTAIEQDFDLTDEENILTLIDSQSIRLDNFQFDSLHDRDRANLVDSCGAQLEEIFRWSGGNTGLTEFICGLVRNDNSDSSIKDLINSNIIDNWQTEERQNIISLEHISIIADQFKSNQELLKIYRQVYKNNGIKFNESLEQQRLIMLGIVKKQSNQLVVSNLIYKEIFNQEWIEPNLSSTVTINSGTQGEPPQPSNWELFAAILAGIQALFSKTIQPEIVAIIALLRIRQIQSFLGKLLSESLNSIKKIFGWIGKSSKKHTSFVKILFFILTILVVAILTINANYILVNWKGYRLQARAENAITIFKDNKQLTALKKAVKVGKETEDFSHSKSYEQANSQGYQLPTTPRYALQTIRDQISEKNQLTNHEFEGFSAVAFSLDGEQIAVAGKKRNREGFVKLFTRGGEEITHGEWQASEGKINSLSFNNEYLATAGEDEKIKIWNLNNKDKKPKETIDAKIGRIFSISFNGDGSQLSASGSNNKIKIWDWKDSQAIEKETLTHSKNNIRTHVEDISFIPNQDNLMITVGGDGFIKIWDLKKSLEEPVISRNNSEVDQDIVTSVSVHPEGKHIVTAGKNGSVKLWELVFNADGTIGDLKELKILEKKGNNGINSVRFSPNGKLIVAGGKRGILKVWNLPQQVKDISELNNVFVDLNTHDSKEITAINFNPKPYSSELVTVANNDKKIRLWNLDEKKSQSSGSLIHQGTILSMSIRSERNDNQGSIYSIATVGQDGKASILDKQAKELTCLGQDCNDNQNGFTTICFAPNGNYLVTVNKDNQLKLWSWKERGEATVSKTLPDSEQKQMLKKVSSLAFYPKNNQHVAVALENGNINYWDLTQNELIGTSINTHKNIKEIVFSPNGKYFATLYRDGDAQIWEWKNGDNGTIISENHKIDSLFFTPDSKYIATANLEENQIIIWDLSGNKKSYLKLPENAKTKLISFTSDWNKLAAVLESGEVRIWELPNKFYIKNKSIDLSSENYLTDTFTRKDSTLNIIDFSSDGNKLIMADNSGRVEV